MTVLSVNINKFALIRNSRGENNPNVVAIADQCLAAGVAGITVHPRPDERHIRYADLPSLSKICKQHNREFNIEGYPSPDFIQKVLAIAPNQVTLVPDPPEALTSSFGWDLVQNQSSLIAIIKEFKQAGIRTSLFVDPTYPDWRPLSVIAPDRVELYTYAYAHHFSESPQLAVSSYRTAATKLTKLGIGLNAGHDLSLDNLGFLIQEIPEILEVSIGHALVCEALQLGLTETLKRYQRIVGAI